MVESKGKHSAETVRSSTFEQSTKARAISRISRSAARRTQHDMVGSAVQRWEGMGRSYTSSDEAYLQARALVDALDALEQLRPSSMLTDTSSSFTSTNSTPPTLSALCTNIDGIITAVLTALAKGVCADREAIQKAEHLLHGEVCLLSLSTCVPVPSPLHTRKCKCTRTRACFAPGVRRSVHARARAEPSPTPRRPPPMRRQQRERLARDDGVSSVASQQARSVLPCASARTAWHGAREPNGPTSSGSAVGGIGSCGDELPLGDVYAPALPYLSRGRDL